MDNENTSSIINEHDQIQQRKHKLQKLRESINIPFPNDIRPNINTEQIFNLYGKKEGEELALLKTNFVLSGRVMTRRMMGKASFFNLQDSKGQIQIYIKQEDIGTEKYEEFKTWDLGDIVATEGELFRTKTGELSLRATAVRLIVKTLRPLPDKYHGLADQELRYRQRYVDLIVNPEIKNIFRLRSKITSAIRNYLIEKDFLEVETPMMHPIPGGASARPFITHHNAMDMELYLRIAPELYLKKLIVGGFEKVFELNRNFRNEGLSTRHNPEFTMLEFYQAYADYKDLMFIVESLIKQTAKQVLGEDKIISLNGIEINLNENFAILTMEQAILHYCPELNNELLLNKEELFLWMKDNKLIVSPEHSLAIMHLEIFEKKVEKLLLQPTFVTCYPAEVSPLARANDENSYIADRFELFICGQEIANGFSELNDPEEQSARLHKQAESRCHGDSEAMYYDEDYINALEYGLPPTGGAGIGIDRLTMILTGVTSIKDIILFPLMRPVK